VSAFLSLVRKDVVIYLSNRRALIITLAAPIFIAAFFGAVLGGPPKKPVRVPIAVVDQDASALTRAIVADLKGDAMFDVREIDEAAAVTEVRNGKLRVAIVLPRGFGDAAPRAMFVPGPKPEITLHVDPSQAMTLAMVKGVLAQHVVQSVARVAIGGMGEAGATAGANSPPLTMQTPFVTTEHQVTSSERGYNPYAHSFAGMSVQFVLFMGIEMGVGVLYMRRLGLWKRLRAAPVSKTLLLGSRVASGTLIATLLTVAIYAAAIAFFGVRIDGSVVGFAGIVVAFALLTSTFGLLIAAAGRTPEATRGIAILATLLLVMLGGAWVPTFVFPQWLQTVTLAVPTRWAIDGLEAMTWRGQGLEASLAPIAVTLAFSAVFAAIALWRFDWEE
jgi:ABC-2 type transport system permease protein